MSTNKHVVVIGLGNPLMGDDGLGLATLDCLRTAYALPPEVELVDGGTWGMNLLPVIEDAGELILIDAIDIAAAPGTLVRLEREGLPRYLPPQISPPQGDFREGLRRARWCGSSARRCRAISPPRSRRIRSICATCSRWPSCAARCRRTRPRWACSPKASSCGTRSATGCNAASKSWRKRSRRRSRAAASKPRAS